MEGNSVCCHVHGFCPYLFVTAPEKFNNSHCKPFRVSNALFSPIHYLINKIFLILQEALNRSVIADMRSNPEKIENAVLVVELVQKQSIYGYAGESFIPFLKITVALPKLVAPCKRLLEKETIYPTFSNHVYQAYESNIDFDIRFA